MSTQPITPVSPLGEEDLGKINAALQQVQLGLQQADLAQRAGIDVSNHSAQLRQTQQQLLAIKQVYFPGR